MTEPKEICTIYLGSGAHDNDYTLYEDGRVKRFYDEHAWSLNNVKWLNARDLNPSIKQKLLDECSEDLKEKARQLLGL